MAAVIVDVGPVVVGLEHVATAAAAAAAVDAAAVDADGAAAAAAAAGFLSAASPLNQDYPSRIGTQLCSTPKNSPNPKVGFHPNS